MIASVPIIGWIRIRPIGTRPAILRVRTDTKAVPTALTTADRWPSCNASRPGCSTIITPARPITMAPSRNGPNRSFSIGTASSAISSGALNKIA